MSWSRLRPVRGAEEALAGADDHRVDLKVQCVDEVVLDQRLRELRAAVDDDVALVPPCELRDFFDDVAAEHGGVVPLGVLEGGGDDVLRHRVELVRQVALVVRPHGREAVVGDPTEQQRVGGHGFVQLELLSLGTARERVGPAHALELSVPLGPSTTPSTEMYSVTTTLPIGNPFVVVLT